MSQIIDTPRAPRPEGPYSQAIAAGGTLYLAGQGPFHPESGDIVGETVEEQTEQVLQNLEAVLSAAGAALGDVVRVGGYLESFDLFDAYNAVYARHFGEIRPARTTVACDLGGILVELDAIAILPGS